MITQVTAAEQQLNDNLFMLELEERLEMVQAAEDQLEADGDTYSCCKDGK